MERAVDARGEFATDALDLGQFLDAGRGHAGEAAEVLEQRRAPLAADAGDLLQRTPLARLLAALAVAGDGEAMRLVAHALDQVQRRRFRPRPLGPAVIAADQGLVPGATLGVFRYANHQHAGDAEIGQHLERLRHLPLAAVDQQHVRQRALARLHAFVAPQERLAHRAVVVAGRDAGDVEATVLRFFRSVRPVHHAGGDGRFA